MVGKQVNKHKYESCGQFRYHERWIPAISVQLDADALLCSIDDGTAKTRESFGDGQLDSSPGGIIVTFWIAAGGNERNKGFWNMLTSPCPGAEQLSKVLNIIQAWSDVWGYQSSTTAWIFCGLHSKACMTVWPWLRCAACWTMSDLRQSRRQRISTSLETMCKRLTHTPRSFA